MILAGVILCVTGADAPALGQARLPTWTPGVPKPRLTGFWKWDCRDTFGVKSEPAGGDLYSISFRGPGGCFEPGTWTPNSSIFGDDAYRVLSRDTIEMHRGERVDTLYLCPSDERDWKDTGWGTRKNKAGRNRGAWVASQGLRYRSAGPRQESSLFQPFTGSGAGAVGAGFEGEANRAITLEGPVGGSRRARDLWRNSAEGSEAAERDGARASERRLHLPVGGGP
jgi:hypothetical protein